MFLTIFNIFKYVLKIKFVSNVLLIILHVCIIIFLNSHKKINKNNRKQLKDVISKHLFSIFKNMK